MSKPFRIQPGLFRKEDTSLLVVPLVLASLDLDVLEDFVSQAQGGSAVGVAATYTKQGVLKALAVASADRVLRLSMLGSGKGSLNGTTGVLRQALQDKLLISNALDKLGFDMHILATALFHDHHLRVASAIDLQSMYSDSKPRQSEHVVLGVLGGVDALSNKNKVLRIVRDAYSSNEDLDVVLRAWVAFNASRQEGFALRRTLANPIFTTKLAAQDVLMMTRCIRNGLALHALKPNKVKNDVAKDVQLDGSGNILVNMERYKTRIRRSDHQKIIIKTSGGNVARGFIKNSLQGCATSVKGKVATVKLTGGKLSGSVRSIHTVGKDTTNVEQDRVHVILAALQRRSTILSRHLVRQIFFTPSTKPVVDHLSSEARQPPSIRSDRPLNTSQSLAVRRILSENQNDRICLIQGPPGTGKTTVIAAVVQSIMANPYYSHRNNERSIWLTAQSNVAVKNIAEKLADVGFFDFKLIVSNEFHFQWHEHLYEKIERNIIVSNIFSDAHLDMRRILLDTRVILCTLSMLSNPQMLRAGVTRLVPLETVLVDEASQIEIHDYLPMLDKFHHSVRKLALIGDDKQLAPYGSDDIKGLSSVFEVKHLRAQAVFLAKQYRMPVHIGNFISRHVYSGRLSTQHSIKDKACCSFIDVHQGSEESKGGTFQNKAEVQAVMLVVRRFSRENKNFRIITPYDGQRALLEQTLRTERLPWEDKCFCVDSFQGNEEDHIILSVVRSEKIGFLSNLRRSNVMLSRCRKSMTICTSKNYLELKASETLLGRMAAEWGQDAWVSWRDLLNGSW